VTYEAIEGRAGSTLRCAATVGRGGSARHLNLSAQGPRMEAWVIPAPVLTSTENAYGPGAGAGIAVLRGFRAERRPS
jgi:hypothetical protein